MRKDFCVHYNGMITHASCRAGILYLTFGPSPVKDWPCCADVGRCEKKRLPTEEKLAAHKEKWEEATRQTLTLMSSIPEGRSGTAPCPKCGSTVDWSRARLNGHLHVRCRTPNCIVVMQ